MKVLVTGFDPFGGETVNPAYEAVKLLPDCIAGAEIRKVEIPTVFSRCRTVVEEEIQGYQPDMVINIGQAGGRSCVNIEKVAINLAEARIPDNDGEQPLDEPIHEDGEIAYFATVPVKAMVKKVREHGLPCQISYSAGTYVCNCVMYHVLYLAAKRYPKLKAGFIHVPFASDQVVDKPNGTPHMSLESMAKSLEYAIEAAVSYQEDIKEIMGTTH